MDQPTAKSIVENLLIPTGISINGQAPWDITVHNNSLYDRVLKEGALGLGEAYMDKWWDCAKLDVFFDRILRANLDGTTKIPLKVYMQEILARIINFQTKHRAKEVAIKHYDLGNDLFTAMLDKQMNYSCAYWKEATNLEEAQLAKLELICKKLELQQGQRLLDIGCGWGSLARYAAENYGVEVVGVTISKQQYDYAKKYCQGLPIDIELKDYREIDGVFDRVVSVGMFEHVGHLNYATFMQVAHQALTQDGLFLLHTIGSNETNPLPNPWTIKYIFPNGMLPSIALIGKAIEKLFVMEDWQNFGGYYDPTLMAWYANFNRHWDSLKANYDERFYRMWCYYLLSCAGGFRARITQLWQIVLSKKGLPGVYQSPR